MTPFMQQVDEVLRESSGTSTITTVPSTLRTLGEGLHNQVELRAVAEQLVCEANTVLREHGLCLELDDTPSDGRLEFRVSCGHTRAWIVTDVTGRRARAHLDVWSEPSLQRELEGPGALAALLLGLIQAERSTAGRC
jgi:hypothetical protein